MDIEMRNAMKPSHRLHMPQGEIRIPSDYLAAANLAQWRPDWKTDVVGKSLALRAGAFIDVGANCGQTLMDYFATGLKTSYLGFEPNQHCVSALNGIISVNNRSDCLVVPVGLSDENAIRKLFLEKGSKADSGASIDAGLRPGREWDVQFVPCYKFDDISSQVGIEKISLMKIDVEGAEFSALRGMKTTLRKNGHWILCEVLHRDSKVDEADHQPRIDGLMSFITELGYTCLNVKKSSDARRVLSLVQIIQFPNKVWTWDNASECDYIFVPRQDADVVSRLFGS